MHVSGLKQSNFLTRNEVGKGMLATIEKLTQENIAKQGAPEELKWCLHFKETEKPLVLNSTNGQLIAQITNEEDTDNWGGHKVVLYDDPTVSFGGKLVGGIRVRAPRNQPATAQQRPAPPSLKPSQVPSDSEGRAVDEDDVPFKMPDAIPA